MKFKKIVGSLLMTALSIGVLAGCEKKGSVGEAGNMISESEMVQIEETTAPELKLSEIDNPVMRKVTIEGIAGYVGYTPINIVSEWKVTNEDGELIDVEMVKKAQGGGKTIDYYCKYKGYDFLITAREDVVDCVKVNFDEERSGECPILFTDYNIMVGQSEEVLEKLGEPQSVIGDEDEKIYNWYIYDDRKLDHRFEVYTLNGVIEQIEMGVELHVTNPKPEYEPDEDVVLTAEDIMPFKLGEVKGNLMTTAIEAVSERFIWDNINSTNVSVNCKGYSEDNSIGIFGMDGVISSVKASGPIKDEVLGDVRIDNDLELSVTVYDIAVGQPIEVLKKMGKPDECTMWKEDTRYMYIWYGDNGLYWYELIIITENGVITTIWSKTGDLE